MNHRPMKRVFAAKAPKHLLEARAKAANTLNAYFKEKHGRQAEIVRSTGMMSTVLSRMAHGKTPVSLEVAMTMELASNGALKAEQICPDAADLITRFKSWVRNQPQV